MEKNVTKSPNFKELFLKSPYLDNKVWIGHKNVIGLLNLSTFLSDLVNMYCGWLQMWLNHKLKRNPCI
jgi:hypothetical protein